MTLVTSAVGSSGFIQISDRRTTDKKSGRVLDERFNKVLALVTSTCAVGIGFTGVAKLGSVPVDRAIAEAIAGIGLREGLMTNSAHMADDIWSAAQRVGDRIQRDTLSLGLGSTDLEVNFAGIHLRHGLARPLHWCVRPGTDSFKIDRSDLSRLDDWSSPLLLVFSGSVEARARELWHEMGRELGPCRNWQEVRARLIDVACNSRDGTVGSNLMIVSGLLQDRAPALTIEFVPDEVETVTVYPSRRPVQVPAYFTPWILASGSVTAPGIVVREQHWTMNGTAVRLRAPDPGLGFSGFFSHYS